MFLFFIFLGFIVFFYFDLNKDLAKDNHIVKSEINKKDQKQYTPIGQYKPTGNLIYNEEMFEKLEKKISNT